MSGEGAERPRFATGQDVPTDSARYRIIDPLGRGGNSDVYLCQAIAGRHKGFLFAAKLMTSLDKPDRVARFAVELKFLKSIEHPGVMRVVDSGTQIFGPTTNRIEVPFYIAEYLPKTLRECMRSGLTMIEKVSTALQLVSALSFLSQNDPPIIHRDIKPENIFVRGRTPVIGDFGLMKSLGSEAVEAAFSVGDLSRGIRFPRFYPTPELIRYAKDSAVVLCPKSDVFQMGLVFAEMFCDVDPIEPRAKPLDSIVLGRLPEISGTQGPVIRAAIARMLELDVAKRPSALDELDCWDGAFREVSSDARRIEGRAFL